MSTQSLAKVAGISAGALLLALGAPYLYDISPPQLASFVGDFPIPDYPFSIPFFRSNTSTNSNNTTTNTTVPAIPVEEGFFCDPNHSYRTELVSLDPLIIYIHDLISPREITALLETAEPRFAPSQVTKQGRQQKTSDRTSESAGLPRDDPAVVCVLKRARGFLGTMIRDGWDEMGPPQLVRYTTGQRFNIHHDWFNSPIWANDGSDRRWNRVASFFAILQDNCTGGETHFPYAQSISPPAPWGQGLWRGQDRRQKEGEEPRPLWREHEDGGLAFRPVAGNAIFWINLHANGTGDIRTNHAGLPLDSGLKTAMNIWPRRYYAYE